MSRTEAVESQPSLTMKDWVLVIESRWKQIPEFEVDPGKLSHLAIISDGNRRAALERGLHPQQGHRLGVEVIKGVMQAGRQWGIRHLTFWVWSTENWKRDEDQVGFVMRLAAKYLRDEEAVGELIENEARFTHLGRKDRLPEVVRGAIEDLETQTAPFDRYYVNLALDYGGLDEIARAIVRLMHDGLSGEQLLANPSVILQYLDTGDQPLPDLVIRTGVYAGEIPHTSGFMPLQTTYSGWTFTPDLFPDLTPDLLLSTIQDFLDYNRRMGR